MDKTLWPSTAHLGGFPQPQGMLIFFWATRHAARPPRMFHASPEKRPAPSPDQRGKEEQMNIKKRLAVLVAATAACVTLLPAGLANADELDPAVSAALQRISDGTWTEADTELISSIPELAAVTPDPRRAPEVQVSELEYKLDPQGNPVSPANGEPIPAETWAEFTPSATADTSRADEVTTPAESDGPTVSPMITGGTWKNTHVAHTHRSLTGATIYKYHHYARFNYGGGKVRAWGSRWDDVTNISSGIYVENRRIVNSKSGVPASSGTSYMKRRIDHCIMKYGCYTATYPWIKTKVYGTGKTSFSSGVSG